MLYSIKYTFTSMHLKSNETYEKEFESSGDGFNYL